MRPASAFKHYFVLRSNPSDNTKLGEYRRLGKRTRKKRHQNQTIKSRGVPEV